jgi:hypothetical protein
VTHWRCAHAPEPTPLKHPCPVHDPQRPCVVAECSCGGIVPCAYCGARAYKHDPFGQQSCCLDCFDQIIGGSE